MIEIQEAVLSLYPEAQFGGPANDGGYDDIRWNVKPDGITKEKVQTEIARLQAEYDAQEYARNRQAEFPSIQDLVVALYDTDDKSAVEAKRAAVKKKYPKP